MFFSLRSFFQWLYFTGSNITLAFLFLFQIFLPTFPFLLITVSLILNCFQCLYLAVNFNFLMICITLHFAMLNTIPFLSSSASWTITACWRFSCKSGKRTMSFTKTIPWNHPHVLIPCNLLFMLSVIDRSSYPTSFLSPFY